MGTDIEAKAGAAAGAEADSETAAAVVIDREVERRVVRKLDMHLVPLVAFLFLLSFLDRSNIGNARIAGMEHDLRLTGAQYSWLLTIFYIPYIIFEFLIIMWKVLPPHVWACIVVVFWGLVATLQAAAQNWEGMMALRFLLGVSEAGYGPGIPYLLSFFYLRHELGFRSGLFFVSAPLATCFSGALAYGITSGHGLRLENWRLLFLVEGLPTLLAAPLAYYCIPDTPQQARFLTADEKRVAAARGVRQAGVASRVGGLVWADMGRTLRDPKAWLTAFMYFSCNVSYASLPVFLPTILHEMGFSGVTAQGLTAPPFFVSAVATLATTWAADRLQQRGLFVAGLACVAGAGYVMLATTKSVAPRYAGVFLAAAGVFPAIANILPWTMNNQGSDTSRGAGMVLLNVVGQCGPLLGTNIFPTSESPFYVRGQAVCAAFMFFVALLALALRALLVHENKVLDARYGTLEAQRAARRRASGSAGSAAKGAPGGGLGADEGKAEGKAEADGEVADEVEEAVENYGPAFRYVL